MKAVFTIEQVDGKLIITIEQAEPILKEQDGIDWSKPVPFPKNYEPLTPVLCRKILGSDKFIKVGAIGYLVKSSKKDFTPEFRPIEESGFATVSPLGYWHLVSSFAAPINPLDHPLHPNFKGNK
jgi:hypothetical protein